MSQYTIDKTKLHKINSKEHLTSKNKPSHPFPKGINQNRKATNPTNSPIEMPNTNSNGFVPSLRRILLQDLALRHLGKDWLTPVHIASNSTITPKPIQV